jgi:hypothetical protein
VTVPKGSGWTSTPATPAWVYLSGAGFAGITKVAVTGVAGSPGTFHVKVLGRSLTLPIGNASLPLAATVVLDVPQANGGQCADASFAGPSPDRRPPRGAASASAARSSSAGRDVHPRGRRARGPLPRRRTRARRHCSGVQIPVVTSQNVPRTDFLLLAVAVQKR